MPKTKETEELKAKVYDWCDRLGYWNVSPTQTAKEINTSKQNVVRWKRSWIKQHGIPQVKQFSQEMNVGLITAMKELAKLAKDPDKRVRISAINSMFDASEKFTKFLEAYGYKEAIAPISDNKIEVVIFGKKDVQTENVISVDANIIDNGGSKSGSQKSNDRTDGVLQPE